MKINLNKPVLNLQGEEMYLGNNDGSKSESLALISSLVIAALTASYKEESDGEEKQKRFELAEKIQNNADEVELVSEDIVFIKQFVNKAFSDPVIYSRIVQALEG